MLKEETLRFQVENLNMWNMKLQQENLTLEAENRNLKAKNKVNTDTPALTAQRNRRYMEKN